MPRYSSYPPLPHWDHLESERLRPWLAGVPEDSVLSLYLHIPFCERMCYFCACETTIVGRYEPITSYVETLHREIDMAADTLGPGRPVEHVALGGGTPTMLREDDFLGLMDHLHRRFDIRREAVIAIEIHPNIFTRDYAATLARAGVNWASLGVQDFDPDIQVMINRVQPFAVTRQSFDWLRDSGITEINVDLVYGLPRQSRARVVENVETVLTLDPGRISLYRYCHAPFWKKHQRVLPEDELPSDEEALAQYLAGAERIAAEGWTMVGNTHFAAPGDRMTRAFAEHKVRHNVQGFTTDAAETVLGFGMSAISMLPSGYTQCSPDRRYYQQQVSAGAFPVFKGIAVSDEDLLRRAVIDQLMCYFAVDLEAVAARYGRGGEHFRPEIGALRGLERQGLLEIEGFRVVMTPAGRLATRAACSCFDQYLEISGPTATLGDTGYRDHRQSPDYAPPIEPPVLPGG